MGYIITYTVDGEAVTVVDGPLEKVLATIRELRAIGYQPAVTTETGETVEISEDAIRGVVHGE